MASGKFTWRIHNFSERLSETVIHSDVFTIGGCNWWIYIYPSGNSDDYQSMYLEVANANNERLPSGWSICAHFSLSVVNQLRDRVSTRKECHHKFTALDCNWGFRSFTNLIELCGGNKGHLVNDTLVVEAEIEVLTVSPPTLVLDMFSINMNKFITDTAKGRDSVGSNANGGIKSEVPSLDEVEMAKQSLKECLSDIFKLNVRDRFSKSLETLSRAEIGLSTEEKGAVQLFWSEFDDFVADLSTFEQENSEVDFRKLAKDQMFHSIKKIQETHVKNKQRLDDLTMEEEEFNKKLEEVKSKKAGLGSNLRL